MTQVIELVAEARENVGKGSARAERRNENVPAVIYGGKAAPAPISIAYKSLVQYTDKRSFYTTIFDIKLDGKSNTVLPRDIQYHPVTDRPLHVDFLRVTKNTTVRVNIPLKFVNQEMSPGLKRGGTLNVVAQEVEIMCSAMAIPANFEVDLSGMPLGQAIRMGDLNLPEGTKLTTKDMAITLASIAVPSALRAKAREEAKAGGDAAAEGEKPAEGDKPAEEAKK